MRRGSVGRALGAAAVMLTSLGVMVTQPADAQDPEVCGYVRYSTSTGPTSTAPYVPHCERPCGGVFVHVPPNSIDDNEVEALACVRGI